MRFSSSFLLLAQAALLVSTVGAAGCCSQNQKDCIDGCDGGASSCEGGACWSDPTLLWLPGGGSENDAQCVARWAAGCQTANVWSPGPSDNPSLYYGTADDSKCCGTLICGVKSDNKAWWTCNHPLEICSSYGANNCPSEICKKVQGKCVPQNSDYYHDALPSVPQGSQLDPTPVPQAAPVQAPTQAPAPPVDCSSRNGSNKCEQDGLCLFVKGDCQPVYGGVGSIDDICKVTLTEDTDKDLIYADVPGEGCAEGYICTVEDATDKEDVVITGTCQPELCLGKKVPGNCNGNNPKDDECVATTERVTICHRTCSETNPWVRITIDEDAWDGEGCGHQQHDVRDECSNKAPWTAWGRNRKDYLIKRHGTRAEVATALGNNNAAEKAYWKKWEHACPYVRNGNCCSWDPADGNPCCGDDPDAPDADVPWADTTPESYCPAVNNLGEGYSAAIGYDGTFPKTSNTGLERRGTDDAISFLVGGNYSAPAAAEIEGKAVVLGDFIIGSQGTNSIGKDTRFYMCG
jgi:hypothetical protein